MRQIFSNVVFQTVLAGTLVFVIGQMIQKSILDQYYAYRAILGRIDNRLKFHSKIIKNPGTDAHSRERLDTASQELLQLSSDLASYRRQLFFCLLTKKTNEKVSEASVLLYELHIGVFLKDDINDENLKKLERIRNLLNLS